MSTTVPAFAQRSLSQTRTDLVPSGIPPIDAQLDGVIGGRTYVLSGAPGTGKSVACLQFLVAALKQGERAAILTQDDPQDLLAQGDFLGIDLTAEIAAERLYLLRYQLDFSRRFSRATSPDAAIAELRMLLGPEAPSRLVIDSIVPFIDAGGSSATSASAMLQLLDDLGATALVTYPGDLAGVYDRRLDPLVQRAAAIFHLAADRHRHRHIEIRKVRYRVPSVAPIAYHIEPGVGIVTALEELSWRPEEGSAAPDRQRLVIEIPNTAAGEALRLLQSHYNVKVVNNVGRRDTPVRSIPAAPTGPARRSSDFSSNNSPALPTASQPTKNGARVAFDGPGFHSAVMGVIAQDPRAFFAVVVVTAPPGELEALSTTTLQTVRAINGDLVGVVNNQVLIYLHGTGRKHAPCFTDRLRDHWQQIGTGELIVDVLAYPSDQERLRFFLQSFA